MSARVSLMAVKREKLKVLLTGATAEEIIEVLRGLLGSDDPESVLAAIDIARAFRADAAPLLPDLLALLRSRLFVPYHSLDDVTAGHMPIAYAAVDVIAKIAIPPDAAALAGLLADTQRIELPEACYDQGSYIGDYATDVIVPAELAARLAPLLGEAGRDLLARAKSRGAP